MSGAFDVFVLWCRSKRLESIYTKLSHGCFGKGFSVNFVPLCGVHTKSRRTLFRFIRAWKCHKSHKHKILALADEFGWDVVVDQPEYGCYQSIAEVECNLYQYLEEYNYGYTWNGVKLHVFDKEEETMGEIDEADEIAFEFLDKWKGRARR